MQSHNIETIILYRPVGAKELKLIKEASYRKFPPRLPEQPIFYPVLNREYATKIARDWNVKASGSGFVTKFAVKSGYIAKFEIQTVGSSICQEYWIPEGELSEFNRNIVDRIEIIAEFYHNN